MGEAMNGKLMTGCPLILAFAQPPTKTNMQANHDFHNQNDIIIARELCYVFGGIRRKLLNPIETATVDCYELQLEMINGQQ